MDISSNNHFLPGDPRLVDYIVGELKFQGIFDQLRKECIADVDTKPAYQNLRQRVEGNVSNFLKSQKWKPDLNKNHVREMLRKNIQESGYLEIGVERIVDQVVNPKINTVFYSQVEDVVYKYLGIERPTKINIKPSLAPLSINTLDLLPTDLDPVSPASDKSPNKSLSKSEQDTEEHDKTDDNFKIDEEESPPFEPIEDTKDFLLQDETSMDSHLSGISGLTSHDSNHSNANEDEKFEVSAPDVSNPDSQLSKVSSNSRLSIVTSDGKITPLNISTENKLIEATNDLSTNLKIDDNSSSKNSTVEMNQESQDGSEQSVEMKDENFDIDEKIKSEEVAQIDISAEIKEEIEEREPINEIELKQEPENITENKNEEVKNDTDVISETTDIVMKKEEKVEVDLEKKLDKYHKEPRSRYSDKDHKDRDKRYDKEKKDRHSSSSSSSKEKDRSKDRNKDNRKDKDEGNESKERNLDKSKTEREKVKDDKNKTKTESRSKSKDNEKSKEKDYKERDKSKDSKYRNDKNKDSSDSKRKDDKHRSSSSSKHHSRDRSSSSKHESRKDSSGKDENRDKSKSSKDSKCSSRDTKSNKDHRDSSKDSKSKSGDESKGAKESSKYSNEKENSGDKKDKTEINSEIKDKHKESLKDLKHKNRDRERSKSESKHSSSHKSSSGHDKREKSSKDSKSGNKKDTKDDHFSSRDKSGDGRRSADRDSNNGGSGNVSQGSNSSERNPISKQNNNKESSSSDIGSQQSGNSEQSDHEVVIDAFQSKLNEADTIFTLKKIVKLDVSEKEVSIKPSSNIPLKKRIHSMDFINEPPTEEIQAPIKIKKPRFASNIFEARKLIKIRKRMEKMERKRQKQALHESHSHESESCSAEETSDLINEKATIDKEEIEKENLDDVREEKSTTKVELKPIVIITDENLQSKLEVESKNTEVVIESPLKTPPAISVISKESWDAIEAKLNQSTMLNIDYASYGYDSEASPTKSPSKIIYSDEEEDCLYFNPKTSPSTERYLKRIAALQKLGPEMSVSEMFSEVVDDLKVEVDEQKGNRRFRKPNLKYCSEEYTSEDTYEEKIGTFDDITEVNKEKQSKTMVKKKTTSESEDVSSSIDNNNIKVENETKLVKSIEDQHAKTYVSDNKVIDTTTTNAYLGIKPIRSAKGRKMKKLDSAITVNHTLLNIENFNLPPSPESDVSASSGEMKNIASRKRNLDIDTSLLKRSEPKVNNRTPKSATQRYSSDDLYKPRPLFGTTRRSRALDKVDADSQVSKRRK